jgi:SulP family sulfate permease
MDRMEYIDQSGLYALEDSIIELKKDGKSVLVVDMQTQPKYMMERIDIIPDLIPEEFIFADFKTCLQWVKNHKDT